MSKDGLTDIAKRILESSKLLVDELIIFAENPIPPQVTDESDIQYAKRLNSLSTAKKKAIEDAKTIYDDILNAPELEKDTTTESKPTNNGDDNFASPEERTG